MGDVRAPRGLRGVDRCSCQTRTAQKQSCVVADCCCSPQDRPFLFYGTTCGKGKARMLAMAVGWSTHVGKISATSASEAEEEDEEANAGAMQKKLLKMTEYAPSQSAHHDHGFKTAS